MDLYTCICRTQLSPASVKPQALVSVDPNYSHHPERPRLRNTTFNITLAKAVLAMGNAPSAPQPGVKMQVIGAGLPRTGTASFSEALRILLQAPIYHGGTQVTLGPEADICGWIDILSSLPAKTPGESERQAALLRQRLDGYAAVTDSPACGFGPKLLELYPEALVICTTRDPASWERSMAAIANVATMWFLRAVLLPLPTMRYFPDYVNGLRQQYLHIYGEAEPLSQDVYHKHVAWLKREVPADRLVFFDVRDGWEPLCKALGKDVPDIPFPKINDSEAIDRLAARMVGKGLKRWAVMLAAGAAALAVTWRYLGTR